MASGARASDSPRALELPPQAYFLVSAVFHYLGPAFAVLLFAHLAPPGVAWLRIATAACIFALWRGPRRLLRVFTSGSTDERRTLLGLGVVLGAMNVCFYLALARLPLGTVGAIEFAGPIGLAAVGARSRRNMAALVLAVAGVWLLTTLRIAGDPLGFVFAFANCALFALYVVLGHRVARSGGQRIDRLAVAMLIALATVSLVGIPSAAVAFSQPALLLAGIGVGVCSSVIPYVCDQLAMARLPRATFALMLSLLPACATVIGLLVLRQVPSGADLAGVALIVGGVALHTDPPEPSEPSRTPLDEPVGAPEPPAPLDAVVG